MHPGHFSSISLFLIWSWFLVNICLSAETSNFKKCRHVAFCRHHRKLKPSHSSPSLVPDSVQLIGTVLQFSLETANRKFLDCQLHGLELNAIRIQVRERDPIRNRFEVSDSLSGTPSPFSEGKPVLSRHDDHVHLQLGRSVVQLFLSPISLVVSYDDVEVISLNSRGLLEYRTGQVRSEASEASIAAGDWEERFKGFNDSKPFGPMSVGLDISFHRAKQVYGIPEHADAFALQPTMSGERVIRDPFRLYNLDVFKYEVDTNVALYGSVPLMIGHSAQITSAVFWNNAAETWIDVDKSRGDSVVDTHWFSETGILDIFLLLGPGPTDVFAQYATLTGYSPLPPMFAMSYHQSRWNYNDEEDVYQVVSGFEDDDIPVDVIWLDIEHTTEKKYLTWDRERFPEPERMQNNLWAVHRRMVTIIDPHIKREAGYHVHDEATQLDHYIKTANGSAYEGFCWPGQSSWIDYLSPSAREWWAGKMAVDNYKGSTLSLFGWNDMNEPSVFDGPEISMHKDAVHHGGWEHRDVHNIYGFYQHQATVEGILQRANNEVRPFVLSRAFFAGSQRFGPVWTGDNTAEWNHLRISIPMLLSLGVAGLSFSGADVGGFFSDPDMALLVRWYQAGAFLPFFRAHAHLDSRRREPHILQPQVRDLIRSAVLQRYALLPYWYTVFWQASKTGLPAMRPLWLEFPKEESTFAIEDQYLIGKDLLVKPITRAHAKSWSVFLPGKYQLWYNYFDSSQHKGGRTVELQADISTIPVFQRAGSIIVTKQRVRRSSVAMLQDPITLRVALDGKQRASGELYVDDGETFDFRKGEFVHRRFSFSNNKLTSKCADSAGSFKSLKSWVEEIYLIGLKKEPNTVTLSYGKKKKITLNSSWLPGERTAIVRKPDIKISEDFTIALSY